VTRGKTICARIRESCGFAAERRNRRGLGKPETFNFLGFTSAAKLARTNSRSKGKTQRDRMRAKLKKIKEEMWRRMHQPIPEQGEVVGTGRQRLLRLPCSADQRPRTGRSGTTSLTFGGIR
jgi:hypothetical protein